MTDMERTTFETGRRHGLVDGFTVPRHLPGDVIGSCSFVTGLGKSLPHAMLIVAEMLGAMAIASARRLSGWAGRPGHAKLTDRQRDCVLRSEEHTSELQSLMRISYAVFCLKKKNNREPHEVTDRK